MTSTEQSAPELHELVQLLAGISRRMRGGAVPPALAEAFRRGSLGPRHMPPLFVLVRRGPSSVGELAERLRLAPATASLLLNELSRAGLVERHEDEHDRRRTIVSVPLEQRRLFQQLADERIGLIRRTLARLEPEAQAHFAEGLRILAEESAAMAGEPERAGHP